MLPSNGQKIRRVAAILLIDFSSRRASVYLPAGRLTADKTARPFTVYVCRRGQRRVLLACHASLGHQLWTASQLGAAQSLGSAAPTIHRLYSPPWPGKPAKYRSIEAPPASGIDFLGRPVCLGWRPAGGSRDMCYRSAGTARPAAPRLSAACTAPASGRVVLVVATLRFGCDLSFSGGVRTKAGWLRRAFVGEYQLSGGSVVSSPRGLAE